MQQGTQRMIACENYASIMLTFFAFLSTLGFIVVEFSMDTFIIAGNYTQTL